MGESFKFDRFGVRYLKAKNSAEKFTIVQFGVRPFCCTIAARSIVFTTPSTLEAALRSDGTAVPGGPSIASGPKRSPRNLPKKFEDLP
ncbi:hypothetical protein MANES_14G015536v8 [Manihot esculenta]|uniref:Uncharacterized protein n=1 Tax=Manihot esculenta TaxID=3983 RepID=A0ACB7GDE8_MANES|nr:hypothetical protein MANES_14G015536v8 [Manihot esculenta]